MWEITPNISTRNKTMSEISNELPLATVARIAKNGTDVARIGESANIAIAAYATNYIKTLSSAASKAASHAGRSTIRSEDVDFVITNGM